MIAITDPCAPSLTAGMNFFHWRMLHRTIRRMPVPMAPMAGHWKAFSVIITAISGRMPKIQCGSVSLPDAFSQNRMPQIRAQA